MMPLTGKGSSQVVPIKQMHHQFGSMCWFKSDTVSLDQSKSIVERKFQSPKIFIIDFSNKGIGIWAWKNS